MYLKTYYQIGDTTCGISSLKTFLYYHSKGKLDLIYEDVYHSSYSLKDLKSIAETYGFILDGVRYEDVNEIKEKSIILLEENGLSHYVFFIKRKKNNYIVIDPSVGEIKINKDEFESNFKGYALILISKGKIKKIKPKLSMIDYLLISIEMIVSIPLILLFTTFFKELYFSFILIIIHLVLLMIKKFVLFGLMDKYDKKLEVLLNRNPSLDKDKIIKLYNYKVSKHTIFSKTYNFFLLELGFTIFLSFLDKGFILGYVFILLNFIELKAISLNKNKMRKIKKLELTNDLNKYNFINKYSSNFAITLEFSKLIRTFIFSTSLIVYYLLFKLDFTQMLGIFVSYIFITSQISLYDLKKEYKNYQIGRTIFDSLNSNIN